VEQALGQSFRFVELANDINNHMPDYVARRLMLALNQRSMAVNGARILLLGLAYKKNTGDARESPAVRVAELLRAMGADVRAVDPYVVETEAVEGVVTCAELTTEEISSADAVILLTDHDAFDYQNISSHASYVLDCRRVLSGENVETL
jgi:UDP-N-acetyl-D-glucosamine dehydrogenase